MLNSGRYQSEKQNPIHMAWRHDRDLLKKRGRYHEEKRRSVISTVLLQRSQFEIVTLQKPRNNRRSFFPYISQNIMCCS